ncbi:MAG: PspC domain-containing protein [Cephaloticoccus sp.]|nr:PspC domain-containing protein [Cephaloticoccus sp.]MCF7761164.1 PspC domain-containing protein [Cephaloticoccus sp.]
MNKVIIINLNGLAYQLEEAGYDALRDYLSNAARRLEGNPDKDEIIADIEQAIADKFHALLGPHKTVVVTREVEGVIAEMGPVQDAAMEESSAGADRPHGAGAEDNTAAAGASDATGGSRDVRRLYRIYDGAQLSGVCNGLGAYFGIDPTIFRVAFVILALAWGSGVVAYFLLVLLIPAAKTPEEKAAASGMAATAQEFIRRAKEGYYEGMRTINDRHAHREWKRKFKQEMRSWKHSFKREMHENTHHWQQNWQRYRSQHPGFTAGGYVLASILSLALFALLIVMLFAIYSLVTSGLVFGLSVLANIPLWVGILVLIVVFQVLSWPLRVARHACHYRGAWGPVYYAGPLHGLVGLGFLVLAVWLADHYIPEFHEWLQQLGPVLHHALDSVKAWWNGPAATELSG